MASQEAVSLNVVRQKWTTEVTILTKTNLAHKKSLQPNTSTVSPFQTILFNYQRSNLLLQSLTSSMKLQYPKSISLILSIYISSNSSYFLSNSDLSTDFPLIKYDSLESVVVVGFSSCLNCEV